jgi:hypothetical protein
MQERDKGSKWLIGFHADSVVRLAGIRRITAWKAVQAEPVEPRRLPDGLIEVYRRGRPRPILVALEVATYPYRRLPKQAAGYAQLIYLVRGVVPEVITLILRPRGRKPVPRELTIRSEEGTTSIRAEWKVIELWKVPAAELLEAGDIGLIPLVPLSLLDRPLEAILDECRERIHRDAPAGELENLLAVTHLLAGLEYNDPRLFKKLGGTMAMLKSGSPLIQGIIDEAMEKGRREGQRDDIITFLAARFGPEAEALRRDLKAVGDAGLEELLTLAATCPDLTSFREQVAPRKRKRRRT